MNKLTAEKCREQFEAWWESFYETSPREEWSLLYSPEHDYYVDSEIDGQYDAWKASRAALEIALPILEQKEQPDNEWIEWSGGECPVNMNQYVEVKFSGASCALGRAGSMFWMHDDGNSDIIAYRVIP